MNVEWDKIKLIFNNRVHLIIRGIRMALDSMFEYTIYVILFVPLTIYAILDILFRNVLPAIYKRVKNNVCEPAKIFYYIPHKKTSRVIRVNITYPRLIQKVNEIEILFEKKRPPGIRRYISVSVGRAGLAPRYGAYPWYYEWTVKVGAMLWSRVGVKIICEGDPKVTKGEDMKIERKTFFTSILKQAIHQGHYYPEDIKRWLTYLGIDKEEIDSLLHELELYRDYLKRHSIQVPQSQ